MLKQIWIAPLDYTKTHLRLPLHAGFTINVHRLFLRYKLPLLTGLSFIFYQSKFHPDTSLVLHFGLHSKGLNWINQNQYVLCYLHMMLNTREDTTNLPKNLCKLPEKSMHSMNLEISLS